MIMKDYADRTWCTKPGSEAWRQAAAAEFKFHCPTPRVRISYAHPDYRIPATFARSYDEHKKST